MGVSRTPFLSPCQVALGPHVVVLASPASAPWSRGMSGVLGPVPDKPASRQPLGAVSRLPVPPCRAQDAGTWWFERAGSMDVCQPSEQGWTLGT